MAHPTADDALPNTAGISLKEQDSVWFSGPTDGLMNGIRRVLELYLFNANTNTVLQRSVAVAVLQKQYSQLWPTVHAHLQVTLVCIIKWLCANKPIEWHD